MLAALLSAGDGRSAGEWTEQLLGNEGEVRRQMFLELAAAQEHRADEVGSALELQRYTVELVAPREVMATIRRTSYATVVDHSPLASDIPAGATERPGPIEGRAHEWPDGDEWRRVIDSLARTHGQLAADYGPLAAEYLLPGAAHSRATLSMTARDAVRLINRLDESASSQPGTKAIADALAREIDEVGDGRILALASNNTD